MLMLEVRNIGKNPARDVTVRFDTPVVPSDDRRSANFSIFDAPIPMVAPGRIIRLPMGSGPAFFKDGQEAPLSYEVNISYTDMTGQVVYNDPPLLLDLTPYKHTSPPRDDAADLVSGIRDIRRILDKWGSDRGLNVVATASFKAARAGRREDAFYDGWRAVRADGARGLWKFTKQRIMHGLR